MAKYDYEMALNADIRDYLLDHYRADEILERLEDRDDFETELNDDLWIEDRITGNASGSYTCNAWTAREYVTDNVELLQEALREYCVEPETIAEHFLNGDWEHFDVTIRCYMLNSAIRVVLDEIEKELEETFELAGDTK